MKDDYLAEAVSVLNQKPHLFNTSILNNIKIARPEATKKEVNDVIEQAQLNELINQLPNGLNTNVEEMGNRFSGGERQRIAFARVLLQDTPRSEEHTSELQSRGHLVCRLLLEKKNK